MSRWVISELRTDKNGSLNPPSCFCVVLKSTALSAVRNNSWFSGKIVAMKTRDHQLTPAANESSQLLWLVDHNHRYTEILLCPNRTQRWGQGQGLLGIPGFCWLPHGPLRLKRELKRERSPDNKWQCDKTLYPFFVHIKIAGIYGCEYHPKNGMYRYWSIAKSKKGPISYRPFFFHIAMESDRQVNHRCTGHVHPFSIYMLDDHRFFRLFRTQGWVEDAAKYMA
jgi:hypothetical protein